MEVLEYPVKISLTVLSAGRVTAIPFEEIKYIRKYGEHTIIETINLSFKTPLSLQEIMEDLPFNDFFRVSRSAIINGRYITAVHGKKIMIGVTAVPVTRYYKKQMKQRFENMLNDELHFLEKL